MGSGGDRGDDLLRLLRGAHGCCRRVVSAYAAIHAVRRPQAGKELILLLHLLRLILLFLLCLLRYSLRLLLLLRD